MCALGGGVWGRRVGGKAWQDPMERIQFQPEKLSSPIYS